MASSTLLLPVLLLELVAVAAVPVAAVVELRRLPRLLRADAVSS